MMRHVGCSHIPVGSRKHMPNRRCCRAISLRHLNRWHTAHLPQVKLELELLMHHKHQRLQLRKPRQRHQQLRHIILRHFPPQHGMKNTRINTIRRPQRKLRHVLPNQRDLAHKVQRPVQSLDQKVRLEQQNIPRHVDVFCCIA